MSVKRIMSMESGIYHQPKCRYIQAIRGKNLIETTQHEAQKQGFRPCKCCNTMDHHYKSEKHIIEFFDTKKGMDFLLDDRHVLYVKTDESCWKLVYMPGKERVGMFHRNYSRLPINFEEPWRERYHKQEDRFLYVTIEDALYYIFEHDKFRAAINAGETPVATSKKYKNAAKKAIRKKERSRMDYLFRMIEGQFRASGDMRQYTFC